jgi:hypothetical protein
MAVTYQQSSAEEIEQGTSPDYHQAQFKILECVVIYYKSRHVVAGGWLGGASRHANGHEKMVAASPLGPRFVR